MAGSEHSPDDSPREDDEDATVERTRRDLQRQDVNRSVGESALAGGLTGVALAGALFAVGSVARRFLSRRGDRR